MEGPSLHCHSGGLSFEQVNFQRHLPQSQPGSTEIQEPVSQLNRQCSSVGMTGLISLSHCSSTECENTTTRALNRLALILVCSNGMFLDETRLNLPHHCSSSTRKEFSLKFAGHVLCYRQLCSPKLYLMNAGCSPFPIRL